MHTERFLIFKLKNQSEILLEQMQPQFCVAQKYFQRKKVAVSIPTLISSIPEHTSITLKI